MSTNDGQLSTSRKLANQYFAGFGAESAWFSDPSSGNWAQLNPNTGAVAARFSPGRLVTEPGVYGGMWGYSVAAGKSAAWFLGRTLKGIAVSEVNLDTRAVEWTTVLPDAAQLPASMGSGFGIVALEGAESAQDRILVALPTSSSDTNGLWSLDGSGAVLARTSYPVPAKGLRDAAVVMNAHSAYVVQYRDGYGQTTLTRYDPTTLAAYATRRFFFPFTTVATDAAVWVVAEEDDDGCLQLKLHRLDPADLTDESTPIGVDTTVIGAADTAVWTLDGDGTRAPFYEPAQLTEHVL